MREGVVQAISDAGFDIVLEQWDAAADGEALLDVTTSDDYRSFLRAVFVGVRSHGDFPSAARQGNQRQLAQPCDGSVPADAAEQGLPDAAAAIAAAEARACDAEQRAAAAEAISREAVANIAALHASTSWRLIPTREKNHPSMLASRPG